MGLSNGNFDIGSVSSECLLRFPEAAKLRSLADHRAKCQRRQRNSNNQKAPVTRYGGLSSLVEP